MASFTRNNSHTQTNVLSNATHSINNQIATLGTAPVKGRRRSSAESNLTPEDVRLRTRVTYQGKSIHMQGDLLKEGKVLAVKRWQPRYVILVDGFLYYWSTMAEFLTNKPHKKAIELSDCSLGTAEEHTKKPFSFGIYHTKRRDYFFDAVNDRQMLDWIHAIERVLGVGEGSVNLEDFDKLTLVGKGAYGRVIQVRKKDTGTVYAMKVLSKEDVLKTNQVQSTKTERRVLEVINHPFIVKLHYAFQTEDKLCLVMDFINGGELFTYINKERCFAETRARFYACEIILALEYIHSMDIIYRDLKPENILIDRKGHIRLTDFGLSKDAMDQQKTYSIVGSPYYMAPEIILKQGHGKASDWWSLGILIYEMLTGLPPFYNKNTKIAYEQLLLKDVEFPASIGSHAQHLLRSLLIRSPAQRLGSDVSETERSHDGVSHIKAHPWFEGTDWDKVLAMEVEVPFTPKVKGLMDTSHFSSTFTSQNPRTPSAPITEGSNKAVFEDFSYVTPLWGDKREAQTGCKEEAAKTDTQEAGAAIKEDVQLQPTCEPQVHMEKVIARATMFLESSDWDMEKVIQALAVAALNRQEAGEEVEESTGAHLNGHAEALRGKMMELANALELRMKDIQGGMLIKRAASDFGRTESETEQLVLLADF